MSDFPTNDDLNREDPLEQLLDEETDEEFGLPKFKDHFADSLTPAVLKDWTAADFASIYVRFRPHLERHARRFLVNPSQVEEVVQDAFLYLMTTLPELDSELGVLKFLKWKTRLLALDVIRANSRATLAPIDDQPEMAAEMPEMSNGLEHADDAAIVRLALAKLQPRHREALIATLYEEKSTEVVAAQMGLSENAFRQLLFRARASFKKALVGEAEIHGKSISQILSIAARKAAAESGKYISAAGAFLVVLAIAVGVLPNLVQSPEISQNAFEYQEPSSLVPQASPGTDEAAISAPDNEVVESKQTEVAEASISVAPVLAAGESQRVVSAPETNEVAATVSALISSTLGLDVTSAGYYLDKSEGSRYNFYDGQNLEVFSGTGVSLFAELGEEDASLSNISLEYQLDGVIYYAVPKVVRAFTQDREAGTVKSLALGEIVFTNPDGQVLETTTDVIPVVFLHLFFDTSGTLISATLEGSALN